MPLSAHFLAVTPDGCPEEIEAGPFTEERAKDALFAWEMNHGCPARVVVLGEAVEPSTFVACSTFNGGEKALTLGGFRTVGSREDAIEYANRCRAAGGGAEVYGLVPAKD